MSCLKMKSIVLFLKILVSLVLSRNFVEKSIWTLGPKLWNPLLEDLQNLASLKTWYGPECKCNIFKYSGNSYQYTWRWLGGNLIPNISKRNIKRNKTVVFSCANSWLLVCNYPLGFIFIHFFPASDLIRSITVFIVPNLIFLLTLLANIEILCLFLRMNK